MIRACAGAAARAQISFEVSDVAANQAAESSADLLLESRTPAGPEPDGVAPDSSASGDRGDDDPDPDTPAHHAAGAEGPGADPASAATSAPAAGADQPQLDLGIPNLAELELVSAGASASTYRAVQLHPRRAVTVKVLHAELDSEVGRRFDRERALTAELAGHSAVVPLLEAGTTSAGQPYAITPFYNRGSLARLVAEHGRLGWREATFLLEPVAVALAELHGRGVVHRGLTPDSVLLTDFLLPRVTDFGLSLPVGERSTAATLIPSLFFNAPELAVPMEADPRADVYSLGAILFAMVTGHVGFVGDAALLTARTATSQARTGKGAAATVLPDALRDLVARAMADEPAHRPANAAAFVSELRRAVARPHEADTGPAGVELDLRREPAIETAASASATMGPVSLAAPDLPSAGAPATGSAQSSMPFDGEAAELDGGPVSVDALLGAEMASAASAHDGGALRPTAQAAQTDARYVLVLAACITAAIMAMVAAAMMAVG